MARLRKERCVYAHLEVREVYGFLTDVVGGERGDEVVYGDAHCCCKKERSGERSRLMIECLERRSKGQQGRVKDTKEEDTL